MNEKITDVYDFIMQRCLWQFFSRNWDREANINSIMDNVVRLQSGGAVDRSTNIANSHYADAKILTQQLTERLDWFAGLSVTEIAEICEAVKLKLLDIAVVNSLNAERVEAKY
ncbi:Fe-only/vanadium nitrogenase subunit delta [Lachnospiraceae bacterium ZAX-1]